MRLHKANNRLSAGLVRFVWWLPACLLIAALGGCGSGRSSPPPTESPPAVSVPETGPEDTDISVEGVNVAVYTEGVGPDLPVQDISEEDVDAAAALLLQEDGALEKFMAVLQNLETIAEHDLIGLGSALEETIALDPNNSAAQAALGVVSVLEFLNAHTNSGGPGAKQMGEARQRTKSDLGAVGLQSLLDPEWWEAYAIDHFEDLDEIEEVVRQGLRGWLIVLLGRLNKWQEDDIFDVPMRMLGMEYTGVRRITYHDIAFLRGMVSLAIAACEMGTGWNVDGVRLDDLLDLRGRGVLAAEGEIIGILDRHGDFGRAHAERWAAVRVMVIKAWNLYKLGSEGLSERLEDADGFEDADGYLLGLGVDAFVSEEEREQFLVYEAKYRTWVQEAVTGSKEFSDSFTFETRPDHRVEAEPDDDEPDDDRVALHPSERVRVDFARLFGGVDLRATYYRTTEQDGHTFLGVDHVGDMTDAMAQLGGVVTHVDGRQLTAADASGTYPLTVKLSNVNITVDGVRDVGYTRVGRGRGALAQRYRDGTSGSEHFGEVFLAQDDDHIYVYVSGNMWIGDQSPTRGLVCQIGLSIGNVALWVDRYSTSSGWFFDMWSKGDSGWYTHGELGEDPWDTWPDPVPEAVSDIRLELGASGLELRIPKSLLGADEHPLVYKTWFRQSVVSGIWEGHGSVGVYTREQGWKNIRLFHGQPSSQ